MRFAPATLRQPRIGADKRDPSSVTLNLVEVREIDPPSPKEAVVWRLLTTHTVNSLAAAVHMVDLYRRRWCIEQVFRALKSQGIDVEESPIADGDALERLAATTLIAATMVMQLVHGRGKAGRKVKAARLFAPLEITVLHALIKKREGKTAKQRNPHPPESLAWALGASHASVDGTATQPSDRPAL